MTLHTYTFCVICLSICLSLHFTAHSGNPIIIIIAHNVLLVVTILTLLDHVEYILYLNILYVDCDLNFAYNDCNDNWPTWYLVTDRLI